MSSCNTNINSPPLSQNYSSNTTSSPFHFLPSDCTHLILHYHVFHLQNGDCWRHLIKDFLPDFTQSSDEEGVSVCDLLGVADPDWNFLRKFAHCCHYYGDSGLKKYLSECRDWKHKPTFYYLKLKYVTAENLLDSGTVEYLRGIQEFHFNFSTENREDLDRMDWSPLFINIRGVRRLSLIPSRASQGRIPFTCENFENLRGIQEAQFYYCDFTACGGNGGFENLRGIQSLTLNDCVFESSPELSENLRGIQELELMECFMLRFSLKDFVNIRGVKSLHFFADYDAVSEFRDEHFEQLRGIQSFKFHVPDSNVKVTDDTFKHLRGVRTLEFGGYDSLDVTDSAMANLRGAEEIYLFDLPNLTSAAFENFRGIKQLYISGCPHISSFDSGTLRNLRGIERLVWKSETEKTLDNETLKQLSGVRSLTLENVSVANGEAAFRYLSEARIVDLCSENMSRFISDAGVCHLVKLRDIRLRGMDLRAMGNLSCLLQLPELESVYVTTCHVSEDAIVQPMPLKKVRDLKNAVFTLKKKNGKWVQIR